MKIAVLILVPILACGPFVFVYSAETNSPYVIDHVKPEVSESAHERWEMMVGKWLGEAPTKEGGFQRWLTERRVDGTYKIHFQVLRNNAVLESSVEVGSWGTSSNIYFTTYRGELDGAEIHLSDPSDPNNYDAYEIIEISREIFRYRHIETGNEFIQRRMPETYQLPEADAV